MKNRSSSSSRFEQQSLHHKFSLLSQNGMMQPQLLEMLEGEGACRDLMNLGFADYEQLACSIPLPEKNGDNFESRDILQSIVQSCSSGDGGDDHIQDCMLHLQRNVGTQNHYYNKPHINQQEQQQHPYIYGCGGSKNKQGTKHKTTRIRWTEPLHKKFIGCVDRLGGAKKATPKGILKLMKCDGLTIFHVKSHLQKYRVCELIPEEKEGNSEQLGSKTGMQIVEALRLQIDVQRRLYEQLESQKELQMRIEEQAKQLQTMLQCQLNTNNLLPS